MTFLTHSASLADASALAHIHVAGWRASYGGLVPQDFLDSLDETKRAEDWVKWLSEGTKAFIARDEQNNPAGFVAFSRLKTPPPGGSTIRPLYTSEILAIYILPDYWRKGLGRQLMKAAAGALKEEKHKSMCLWVLEKNKRGVDFYKALGGQKCGSKDVEIGGAKLKDICYGWRSTDTLIA